jgi:phosphinothricin acetyltransferase
VSTAIYVGRGHHRRGAGRALYTTLFALLRALGYYKAVAGITLPNPASVGLHETMGFELVGVYRDIGHKLGAWHDVAWYQAAIQPPPPQPQEPRPIEVCHGTPAWVDAMKRGADLYVERT